MNGEKMNGQKKSGNGMRDFLVWVVCIILIKLAWSFLANLALIYQLSR